MFRHMFCFVQIYLLALAFRRRPKMVVHRASRPREIISAVRISGSSARVKRR